MKRNRSVLALTLILLGFLAAGPALAGPYGHRGHGSHLRFSVIVGAPIGWYYGGYYAPPYYAYPPYYSPYYYPPVVAAPSTPPTYIEQPAPAQQASPAPQNYWYYCAESQAYYPYVSQCAGTWQRVSPAPPQGG